MLAAAETNPDDLCNFLQSLTVILSTFLGKRTVVHKLHRGAYHSYLSRGVGTCVNTWILNLGIRPTTAATLSKSHMWLRKMIVPPSSQDLRED